MLRQALVDVNDGTRELISNSNYLNATYGSVFAKDYVKIRGGSDRLPYAFADYLNDYISLASHCSIYCTNF